MRSNRSLARVSLLGNKIGNAGGEELKSALIDSPNVESLELAGNAMDRLTLTTIESLVADRSNGIDLKVRGVQWSLGGDPHPTFFVSSSLSECSNCVTVTATVTVTNNLINPRAVQGRIAEQQRAEIAAAKAEAEARAKAAREAAAQEAADAEAARQARLHTPHVRPPPPHIEVPGAGSSASGGTTGGVDASPVEVVPLVGGGSGSTSATPEPSTDGSPVTTEPSEPAAKPPQASSSKLPLILGAVVVVGAVVGGLLWWKKK